MTSSLVARLLLIGIAPSFLDSNSPELTITEQQKEELITRHRGERDRRICDRIKAVIMYDKGYSVEEISNILLLSDEAIRKHLRDYQKHNKLHTNNGGGFAKLDKSNQQESSRHLEENNYVLVKDICAYVENKYGLKYTVSGMTRLLYKMNFVYKKPKLVPGKLDENKQEEFKLQYKLLKSNLKANEAIYFMDSVHPQYQARSRYGWIKKGKDKTLPTNSGWKRMHIVGAINIDNLHLVKATKAKINGEYIIEFLKKLEESTVKKEKIYLICDNAGYHKSKLVKEYLKDSKIELIYLPPYSPNLNPIERLWKFMHSKTTCNRYYENFEKFTEKIDCFFENIVDYYRSLRKLINDNFQTIIPDHFNNSSR